MKIQNLLILMLFTLVMASSTSCNKDDDDNSSGQGYENVRLELTQIPDLGFDYFFHVWLEHENQILDMGEIVLSMPGQDFTGNFNVGKEIANSSFRMFVTVEPFDDTDPGPSEWVIWEVQFEADDLIINSTPFVNSGNSDIASGSYILATPTTSSNADEFSGIWFVSDANQPQAGLELPQLNGNWTYEGWVQVDGNLLSTGQFDDPSGSDSRSTYSSGERPPYPFPGEDFVNALPGIPPPDLRGKECFVTIEPKDNNTSPFFLNLLEAEIDNDAPSRVSQSLSNTEKKDWLLVDVTRY